MSVNIRLPLACLTVVVACAAAPVSAQDTSGQGTPAPQGPMMGYPGGGNAMTPGYYRGGGPMHDCQHMRQGGHKGPMHQQRHQMMQGHRQQMEERLARIEALLQQLVDRQQ